MQVVLDNDATDNGLASMLKDLIMQNVQAHPERGKDLKALKGNIAIIANDIDVKLTMTCNKGDIVIHEGIKEPCNLMIETDSDSLLKLTALKIKLSQWRHYFDKTGREILGMLFNGRLKINGLFKHPLMLIHLTRLFSVY